jgi:hypothetical protein
MLLRRSSWVFPFLLLATGGCSTGEIEPLEQGTPAPVDEESEVDVVDEEEGSPIVIEDPIEEVEPLAWTSTSEDLSTRLPEGTVLTGVTRDPIDGSIYLVDPYVGIYHLKDAEAPLVFEVGSIVPEDGELVGEFSDVASMGFGRFALTVPNEGYLLDVEAGTMWRHFCYLPNEPAGPSVSISLELEAQGIAVWQQTDSLAYDTFTGAIFAQPQTLGVDTNEVYGSELANFAELTGEPLNWLLLGPPITRAGGLALTQDEVLLGQGSDLYVYWRGSAVANQVQTLDIPEISGLHAGPFEDVLAVSKNERVLYRLRREVVGE